MRLQSRWQDRGSSSLVHCQKKSSLPPPQLPWMRACCPDEESQQLLKTCTRQRCLMASSRPTKRGLDQSPSVCLVSTVLAKPDCASLTHSHSATLTSGITCTWLCLCHCFRTSPSFAQKEHEHHIDLAMYIRLATWAMPFHWEILSAIFPAEKRHWSCWIDFWDERIWLDSNVSFSVGRIVHAVRCHRRANESCVRTFPLPTRWRRRKNPQQRREKDAWQIWSTPNAKACFSDNTQHDFLILTPWQYITSSWWEQKTTLGSFNKLLQREKITLRCQSQVISFLWRRNMRSSHQKVSHKPHNNSQGV